MFGDATVIYDHRGVSGETSFVELLGDGSRIEDMSIVMNAIRGRRQEGLREQSKKYRGSFCS